MGSVWSVLKWVLGVLAVLLVLAGALGLFVGPKAVEAMRARAEAGKGAVVEVEPASVGTLVRTVSAPGSVSAKESVNISSRVSAEIRRLAAEEGDEVSEGDVLVELDAEELRARLSAAEARLRADEAALRAAEASLASEQAGLAGVKASLDKALADLERAQELHASGDVSEAQLQTAEAEADRQRSAYEARLASITGVRANVEAARARVAVAQADVDEAADNVERAVIRSPMTGVVTRVNSREGEIALGTIQNQGAIIMTVADLSEMLVRARVAEVDVAMVRVGQRAKIYINGYPDEVFEGEIRRIALENQIDSDRTSFYEAEIVLELEAGRRIFAGLTANVEIEVETLTETIVVPSQAVLDRRVDELPREVREDPIVTEANRTFAQVVYLHDASSGEASVRPVKLAAANLTSSAIEAGLEAEEPVIVGPFRSLQDLSDGDAVRLEEENGGEDGPEPGEEPTVAEAEEESSEDDAEGGDENTTEVSAGSTAKS